MDIFGINLSINMNNLVKPDVVEDFVSEIVKKNDERKIFNEVLNTKLIEGKTIKEDIKLESEKDATIALNRTDITKQVLQDFAIGKLKKTKQGKISVYESLLRGVIEYLDDDFKIIHTKLDNAKMTYKDLPYKYPGIHNKAVGIIEAKIKDGLNNKVKMEFLMEKIMESKLRSLAHEMFYATNRFNLNNNDLLRYTCLMYELDKLKQAPIEQSDILKTEVAGSIKSGNCLEMIHIKSLRYTYPNGKRLQILENTDGFETKGIKGERRLYPSEEVIVKRLANMKLLFDTYRVRTNLTVIIADNDLECLFPERNGLVDRNEIVEARKSANKYVVYLGNTLRFVTQNVYLLTDYLKEFKLKNLYLQEKDKVVSSLRNGRGPLKEAVVEERVNHQFEHYHDMFGEIYSRSQARDTALNMIANNMALSVVFSKFRNRPIVFIDDRGEENKLIGGITPTSRAVFLTKLKDPVKVVQ